MKTFFLPTIQVASAKYFYLLNICEQLYSRITGNIAMLIESGKYVFIEENGKTVIVSKRFIRRSNNNRLKSSSNEGGESRIYIGYGCNEPQAVIDGFKRYDENTTGSMNEIWNMDSRNWGTAAQNIINTSFSIGGYNGSVQLANGCFNGSNNCSGNIIGGVDIQWDSQSNSGIFVLNDCQGLPLAVIRMYGNAAFQYMKNIIRW